MMSVIDRIADYTRAGLDKLHCKTQKKYLKIQGIAQAISGSILFVWKFKV